MVARITFPKSLQEALNYNEHKVKKGVAECIAERNFLLPVSAMNFYHKLHWFEERNALNERASTRTLHVSLNFHPSEKPDYNKLIDIGNDYMEGIGFADQPYLIYCHHDAGHPHIHILSTLIREDGTRIYTNNIGRDRSEPARKQIEEKYKLIRAQSELKPQVPERTENLVYGKAETKRSIANALKQVLTVYKYTSLAELNAVLKGYGAMADRGNRDSFTWRKGGLLYRMLDAHGNPKGVPIKASTIAGKPTLKYLERQFEKNAINRDVLKVSLQHTIDHALKQHPKNIDKLIELLQMQKITTVLRQNAGGRIYGITFIDHRYRSVFNGSDIHKVYSIAGLYKQIAAKHPQTTGTKSQSNNIDQPGILDDLLRAEPEFNPTPQRLKKKKKKRNQ
jgi:hypothetical protein